jgi:beta-ureidopropionase / N-carbamoyl-L-amino-acid hydrolase
MNSEAFAVNGARLWSTIMESAAFGATERGGICRLTLTDTDRQVRDWFRTRCEAAACKISVDSMGNIFARKEGLDAALPPIAIGSHLDTQPTGGRFDGILGVLAGLEVVRTLQDYDYRTRAPLEVIDWTNEEGSRFPPAMLCSGVFAGVFPPDYAYSREDRNGKRFDAELARIGYQGTVPCGSHPLGAHFELHIEQGPILEDTHRTIGVVTGIQGMRWYEVTIRGVEAHAGSTPMRLRRDALLGAGRIVSAVHELALEHRPNAVATVGLLECRPNSRNTVPGSVFLTVDLRNPDDHVLEQMESSLRLVTNRIGTELNLQVDLRCVWNSPAVRFDENCIAAVRDAAQTCRYPSMDMVSGAGHDSGYISRVAPTAMIFVPCATGLSHNEEESATQGDVTAGANVLLRAVLETDRRLAAQRGY